MRLSVLSECNVCVTYKVLDTGDEGYHLIWKDNDGNVEMNTDLWLRARGQAEFKPAKYQFRRGDTPWPDEWVKTDDLAGNLGWLGMDDNWEHVRQPMKEFVLGLRPNPPSLDELKAAKSPWGQK
jgi:hypothetical protein